MDVQEQRVKFAVAATRKEKSLTALCQEFGIFRPTGYLWPGAPSLRALCAKVRFHCFIESDTCELTFRPFRDSPATLFDRKCRGNDQLP